MGDAPPGMAAPPSEAGGAVAAAAHEGGSQQSPPRLNVSGCGGSPGTTTASTVLTASDWLARGVVAATLLSRDQPVDEDEDEEDEDEDEEVGSGQRVRVRVRVANPDAPDGPNEP